MADEIKKVEIDDEDLDLVAGGYIPPDQWNNMSTEERIAAKKQSKADRAAGNPCILD